MVHQVIFVLHVKYYVPLQAYPYFVLPVDTIYQFPGTIKSFGLNKF